MELLAIPLVNEYVAEIYFCGIRISLTTEFYKGKGKDNKEMKYNLKNKALMGVSVCIMAAVLSSCTNKAAQNDTASVENESESVSESLSEMPTVGSDANTDINLEGLQNSVDTIRNLDLGPGSDSTEKTSEEKADDSNGEAKEQSEEAENEHEGEKTVYSYTDVISNGNDLYVYPNGGLNGSTVLYGDKDLTGFLDYVDSNVLEDGRKIDRDLFCDIFSIMLVDKELSSDINSIEKNIIMALAMANNFYDADVKIKECYLDANNAAEYHYKLSAYGKDDTWLVNYGKRTIYFNDGATEYSSDMFKDEYLALWMTAFEEYYGVK